MTAVGDTAPDFTLKDQSGNDVTLSSLRGTPVVIVFYPFTFTGVCEGELCEIRDDPGAFERAGAQVLAISCDTRHAQRVWAEQQGFTFPVLSDFWPHGEVWVASADVSGGDLKIEFAGRGEPTPGTDVALVRDGYVAVTPLTGISRASSASILPREPRLRETA